MKGLWARLSGGRAADEDAAGADDLRVRAERGQVLVEESPELVLVLDERNRVVAASRRAREALEGVAVGTVVTEELLRTASSRVPVRVPYEAEGRRETLVYLGEPGDPAGYEELRAGFTAAVSHELRTPLARLLALLETALLPDADTQQLVEQARAQTDEIAELIEDILFLGELESGRAVVGLGSTVALPVLREVAEQARDSAARAGIGLRVEGEETASFPLRARMLRVVATNLVDNAVRYAGAGATLVLSVRREDGSVVLTGADDGVGVSEDDLPRLFERFYRGDRARASRGTGLGLAIVKHVVTAAGGTVEASGVRGHGLTVRCVFPA